MSYTPLTSISSRVSPHSSHSITILKYFPTTSRYAEIQQTATVDGTPAPAAVLHCSHWNHLSVTSLIRLIRVRRRRIISGLCRHCQTLLAGLMATNYLIVIGCRLNCVYCELYNACGRNDTHWLPLKTRFLSVQPRITSLHRCGLHRCSEGNIQLPKLLRLITCSSSSSGGGGGSGSNSTLSWPVQNFISRKYSFKPTFFSGLSSPLNTQPSCYHIQYAWLCIFQHWKASSILWS